MAVSQPQPIAIVGMSCRLPGNVESLNDFWKMLCRARSGWSKVPSDRFNAEAYSHPNPHKKGCFNSKGGYFLKQNLSMFDAGFFDITKKEAESMECTYEALENAGIPKEELAGKKVGVFIGSNYSEHRMGHFRDLDTIPTFEATGNQGAFLAGRLAYYFDLRGPTVAVDAACSSSMHALHLAVQSIRSGESEQAIVGASHLIIQPDVWVSMAKLRLFSEAGKTYAFDHRAESGYARGEGAGCVVLKPLDHALADNDHIRAVITHTAISHNGRTVGLAAPSAEEQELLLRNVFAQAKVNPRDVGFFEAHGTGTEKGDPVEATAIYKAVASNFTPGQPLYLGSTKGNVGHLECASGIVSVIKSALMLYYGFVLPNAGFEKKNAAVPLEEWNMCVPTLQKPWPSNKPYACVNNFGFSGSNATCILSTAPMAPTPIELSSSATYTTLRLFVLSANDGTALKNSMKRLGIFLEQHAELYQHTMPRNLAYTLCQRRSRLPWRVAFVAGTCSGLAGALNNHEAVLMRAPTEVPKLAFIFTGQGAQWWAMGRELLKTHPVFRTAISRADSYLKSIDADFSIMEELIRDKKTTKVGLAYISQPICTALQLALVDLLASFGIRPQAVAGHSSGEIGAAYAAGALSFESAMAAAYYRGQAIVELERIHHGIKGSMMVVGAGSDELGSMLSTMFPTEDNKAVVACENSPSSTTLSGDKAAIDQLAAIFQEKGIFNRKLSVDVAYHSHHMRLIADFYLKEISGIRLKTEPSGVQFFSSLKGRKIQLGELGEHYWVDNLTEPVHFTTSLQCLCKEFNPDILIEVGPHSALKGPIMQTLKKPAAAANKIAYLPALVRDQDATRTTLELVGQLFVRGHTQLDWYNINHRREETEKPHMIHNLFPYPWTRQNYWHESRINRQHRLKTSARNDLLGVLADWSSDLEPTWRSIIRTEDLPWLREYRIYERLVFPMAGFVSMIIEAAAQRAAMKGLESTSYNFEIKDLKVAEQLFLEDQGEFEVLLNLRPLDGEDADEFRISSYEARRGWMEHCRGVISTEKEPFKFAGRAPHALPQRSKAEAMLRVVASEYIQSQTNPSFDSAPFNSRVRSAASSYAGGEPDTHTPATEFEGKTIKKLGNSKGYPAAELGSTFYKNLEARGVSYPRAFQSLVAYTASDNEASAHCCAQNTASDMPFGFETPYRAHPSVLDAMLQLPLLSISAGGAMDFKPHLPDAIKQLHMSAGWMKRPGESFYAHSMTETKSSTFMIEAFSSPGSDTPSVSILGLQLSPVRSASSPLVDPRELCFKVQWQPAGEAHLSGPAEKNFLPGSNYEVVIVTERERPGNDSLVAAVTKTIETHTGVRPHVTSLLCLDDFNSRCIVISELDKPMLSPATSVVFEQVKKLLTQAPGLLWVTRGASKYPTTPNANMALGLIRTARSEREAVAATLDLDPFTKLDMQGQAALIQDAFHRAVLYSNPDAEMEFAEEKGQLVVPRFTTDERMNLEVHRELGPSAPYLQEFHQPKRQLQLSLQASCEDIYFEDRAEMPLNHDEIEILVAASTLSQDDVALIKEGQDSTLSASLIARGCSGNVTRVGISVGQFAVGDTVCALTEGVFGTHARARVTSVSKIPSNVSIETAATIPHAFTAAYYALVEVAHVRPRERILVPMSGPISLAVLEVARHLGADLFVLTQNDAQKDAARKLGITDCHILSARSIYLTRELKEVTGGDGIEVIVATSDDTFRAWECLADFGRVVEVKCLEAQSRSTSMSKLGANTTFTSVNLTSLAATRPRVVERMLKVLMEKFASGDLRQSATLAIFPVSQISKALCMVREGAVSPVVLVAGVHEQLKAVYHKPTSIFRHNGTHVIIGGTGGLGRSVARWMIERGARNIVLLSRNGGAKDRLDCLLEEIKCPDACIMAQKCDVSDETQVRQWLKDLKTSLPPICGVVHAAAVLRDGLLEGMTHASYEEVIRPKVQGTWNIHNALLDAEAKLDYFVALSSAAGILGSRGQAAYAAANTFLDAFMQFRVRNGLPGVALDLTAVTGAGYIAENAERETDILKNFGNETISEQEVLALLSAAVRGTCSSPQCLTGLKLHLGRDGSWPYYARDARFTQLKHEAIARAQKEGHDTAEHPVSAGEVLRAAKNDAEIEAAVRRGILQRLSEELAVPLQDLDATRNITSYGLDSLTAIELRNWIARELRVNLQVMELLSSGSVNGLSALIVRKLKGG